MRNSHTTEIEGSYGTGPRARSITNACQQITPKPPEAGDTCLGENSLTDATQEEEKERNPDQNSALAVGNPSPPQGGIVWICLCRGGSIVMGSLPFLFLRGFRQGVFS